MSASIADDNAGQKYLAAKADNTEREKWANQYRWELARHTVSIHYLQTVRFNIVSYLRTQSSWLL